MLDLTDRSSEAVQWLWGSVINPLTYKCNQSFIPSYSELLTVKSNFGVHPLLALAHSYHDMEPLIRFR